MSFWRKDVVDFALDQETRSHIDEQKAWIAREPANPAPYYHLALLYRMQWKHDAALGLLLEAVRLNDRFASAHVALAEMYAVAGDMTQARLHAEKAESLGEPAASQMLRRHGAA